MDKQAATFWIILFTTLVVVARTPLDFVAWQEVREAEKRLRQAETKLAAMELVRPVCPAPAAVGTTTPQHR